MNEGISPLELVLGASLPVQFVFVILFIASVVSWVMIVQRWMVLSAATRGVQSFENRF